VKSDDHAGKSARPDKTRDRVNCHSTFASLASEVAHTDRLAYPLAALNDLLTAAAPEDIRSLPVPPILDPYRLNYVTAMVELAAHRAGVIPPAWTAAVEPLSAPVFAVPYLSVRAHLLTASPPPFRRRNIFIDSSLGDRV
jgi:hypothetical protein